MMAGKRKTSDQGAKGRKSLKSGASMTSESTALPAEAHDHPCMFMFSNWMWLGQKLCPVPALSLLALFFGVRVRARGLLVFFLVLLPMTLYLVLNRIEPAIVPRSNVEKTSNGIYNFFEETFKSKVTYFVHQPLKTLITFVILALGMCISSS